MMAARRSSALSATRKISVSHADHWHTLLTQLWRRRHVPQLSVPPHPSEAVPQLNPSWEHVFGVQVAAQTLLVQVWPAAHVPQLSVPPQPSEAVPHLNPSWEHVFGVQAPGLMVRFLLAEVLLQVADAATVTWSWVLTADVESVTDALLAPTGTVTVPVQAGDPVQPGKVAI